VTELRQTTNPVVLKLEDSKSLLPKSYDGKQENSGAIHFSTLAGLLNLSCGAGNMKFNTQNEELLIVHIITCIILPEYFSLRLVQ
jgi:hypothetical protein